MVADREQRNGDGPGTRKRETGELDIAGNKRKSIKSISALGFRRIAY
jgi:hypothetical protein